MAKGGPATLSGGSRKITAQRNTAYGNIERYQTPAHILGHRPEHRRHAGPLPGLRPADTHRLGCRPNLPPHSAESRGTTGQEDQSQVGRRGVRPQGDGAPQPHRRAAHRLPVHPRSLCRHQCRHGEPRAAHLHGVHHPLAAVLRTRFHGSRLHGIQRNGPLSQPPARSRDWYRRYRCSSGWWASSSSSAS